MELFIIGIASLLVSMLTFFTGFGLGTLLMPVFAIWFPVDVAVALTGVVHLLNNIFKLFLTGKKADLSVVLRFGIPAMIDLARLTIYFNRYISTGIRENLTLLIVATLAAFAGAFTGTLLLKKITFSFIQRVVTIMLILLAVALGLGLV